MDDQIRQMESVSRTIQRSRKLNMQPTDIFNKKKEESPEALGMQNSLMKIPSVTRGKKRDL